MPSLAIIGTGVAGLGCAHFLHRHFRVTLFEQDARPGGHTHTVTVPETGTGRPLPIDTGFMVFNYETYPQLTRLFGQLSVAIADARIEVWHAKYEYGFGVRSRPSTARSTTAMPTPTPTRKATGRPCSRRRTTPNT